MRSRFALAAVAALALLSSAARADGDPDGAKKHFEAGRKARDEGDCVKAVAEFEASVAADKSIGAYYNLGFCQEQLGHRQEAYDGYKTARDMANARGDARLKEITAALWALLETANIRLTLPQPLPPGVEIFVDGELVPAALYGSETVVFTKARPSHDVHVTAPGYQDVNAKVESRELKAIDLRPVDAPKAPSVEPPPPSTEGGIQPRHIAGAAVILGGVVLGAIGITALADYLGRRSTLQGDVDRIGQQGGCAQAGGAATCKNLAQLTPYNNAIAAYDHRSEKWKEAEVPAIGGVVVGALAIAGGAYLLWTAPPLHAPSDSVKVGFTSAIAPIVSPTVQGLSLSGTF